MNNPTQLSCRRMQMSRYNVLMCIEMSRTIEDVQADSSSSEFLCKLIARIYRAYLAIFYSLQEAMASSQVRSFLPIISQGACRQNPAWRYCIWRENCALLLISMQIWSPPPIFSLLLIHQGFPKLAYHIISQAAIQGFSVGEQFSNDYIHDRRSEEIPLHDLRWTVMVVYLLLDRSILFKEHLLLLVTGLLVSLPSPRMLVHVVLSIYTSTKLSGEVLYTRLCFCLDSTLDFCSIYTQNKNCTAKITNSFLALLWATSTA